MTEASGGSNDSALSALGILGFGGGVALVAYILSGISMAVTLVVVATAGGIGGRFVWTRTTEPRRADARDRLYAGLRSGIAALVAYDLSRWALVEVSGFAFGPFEAFSAFGRGLGVGTEGAWATAAGAVFHVANGIGFAVAYSFLIGPAGPAAGVAFALGLEACMVLLYPQWLRLQALDEFLQVSLLGHVAYGLVLGFVARREIGRRRALRREGELG